jgi:hypothetical protein
VSVLRLGLDAHQLLRAVGGYESRGGANPSPMTVPMPGMINVLTPAPVSGAHRRG